MISDLCGQAVEWGWYDGEYRTTGYGRIRAVYADVRPNMIARVVVEVTEVLTGTSAKVGELLDMNCGAAKCRTGAE